MYELGDHIATLTLNRPEKPNAWTAVMEGEYRHGMEDAEQRDDVRVIVAPGAGKGSRAGADMNLLSTKAVQRGVSEASASRTAANRSASMTAAEMVARRVMGGK